MAAVACADAVTDTNAAGGGGGGMLAAAAAASCKNGGTGGSGTVTDAIPSAASLRERASGDSGRGGGVANLAAAISRACSIAAGGIGGVGVAGGVGVSTGMVICERADGAAAIASKIMAPRAGASSQTDRCARMLPSRGPMPAGYRGGRARDAGWAIRRQIVAVKWINL